MQTGVYYGDPTSGVFGATAVFIALWHRRRTGKGQFIDFAQQEGLTALLPQILYEHLFNQRTLGPMGNKHPSMAPHGCYRCAGEDSWVVIAVASDREWQALCQALGQPTLARDPRFNTTLARLRNREELDQVIEDWTRQRDHYEVMHTLQKGGVAAEAVLANNEVLSDPHYQARGFFEEVPHPEAGTHPLVGVSWKMSKTPGKVRMAAPCLGQHNELILGELLGLSEEELASLAQKQVIGKIPIGSHPYVAR